MLEDFLILLIIGGAFCFLLCIGDLTVTVMERFFPGFFGYVCMIFDIDESELDEDFEDYEERRNTK